MFRFLAIAAIALPLGACTTIDRFITDLEHVPGTPTYEELMARDAADREWFRKHQQRSLELIEQGAMDPLDRLEVEANRAYVDAQVEASIIEDYGY